LVLLHGDEGGLWVDGNQPAIPFGDAVVVSEGVGERGGGTVCSLEGSDDSSTPAGSRM